MNRAEACHPSETLLPGSNSGYPGGIVRGRYFGDAPREDLAGMGPKMAGLSSQAPYGRGCERIFGG